MKTYEGIISELPSNGIFVFGSNRQGRHGLGAALYARKHFGARYGQSHGLQGRSYGICTKDLLARTHPSVSTEEIILQIGNLYELAEKHLDQDFYITYGGQSTTYLCGYNSESMAIMFSANERPSNIVFEKEFGKLILL